MRNLEKTVISDIPPWEPKKIIYLAVPYYHIDPDVRRSRYEHVNKVTAYLLRAGNIVFSPITYSHVLGEYHNLPDGHEFWMNLDVEFLRRSDILIVLCLNGWRESRGVTQEIKIATEMDIPIIYLPPMPGA